MEVDSLYQNGRKKSKSIFPNDLQHWDIAKNIDENGFHIPKLRENSSFYTSNRLLEAFLKLHKLTLIVVFLILLCKTHFSSEWAIMWVR